MRKIGSILLVTMLIVATLIGCTAPKTATSPSEEAVAPAQTATETTGEETAPAASDIKIGVSFATMQEEKWQRDRAIMEAKAAELGIELVVQSANGDEELQNSQCENLITQGVDALIVIAQDSSTAGAIVESAHEAGIPVVAHDRLIADCDLDYYASFDCYVVGQIQGQFALDHAPTGNYFLISGSPTDNNAHLMREGQMSVLQPAIDKGDIKIVVDQWCNGWSPEEALQYTEDGLSANNNDVVCVLTSNDGTAGAAIQALAEQGLAGKVIVTGLDAELAACQRVVEGTQSMTVYRRFALLDETAVEIAYMLVMGIDPATKFDVSTTNNGKIDVPSVLLTDSQYMYAATADRMQEIIDDGWLAEADIYKNVTK
ncbi:MAG: sugar ABC transporter substrate-binding protein [Clostridiales bacterium]|nr:sugar ABC transporter substrate-binding protein [Clostridiales bacterium]